MKALIALPNPPRPSPIEKAIYARVRAQLAPIPSQRDDIAKLVYADDRLVNAIVERGAAPVATTTGSGWAAELNSNLVGDFLASMAPLSAAAALMARGLNIRMAGAKEAKLPQREGGPSTLTAWVGEGDPIPVRSFTLNDGTVLSPRKYGFIIAISREVAKRVGGEAVVRQLMREDGASTLDASVFNAAAGDGVIHKGLLNDVSPLTGYPGDDREAMEADLIALSDVVAANGSGEVAYIVSPKRAARFKILAPDLNRELTMLPSLAVADTTVIAVDPLSIAWGAGDDFDIDATNEAVLHMDDDPAQISDGEVAAPVRSLWQTDSIALRFLADVAFAARRSTAVSYLTGATW